MREKIFIYYSFLEVAENKEQLRKYRGKSKIKIIFQKKLSVSVIFQRNDTIARILNLKNYFYYILCGVSVNSLPEEPE